MKMIVLGNERIGKTTFVTALREFDGDPTKVYFASFDSFLWINVILQTFDHSTIVSTVGIDCQKMKISRGMVTVMDFAGQMEYSVTHQFFLSKEVCEICNTFSCY